MRLEVRDVGADALGDGLLCPRELREQVNDT